MGSGSRARVEIADVAGDSRNWAHVHLATWLLEQVGSELQSDDALNASQPWRGQMRPSPFFSLAHAPVAERERERKREG